MLVWIEDLFRALHTAIETREIPPNADYLLLILAGALAFWAGWRTRRIYLRFPELPRTTEGLREAAVAIVPARDEARHITRAVTGLRGVPVVVVDDGSSDTTAELASAAGAQVMPAPPLPGRVLGKSNACWAGSQATTEPWLLFSDADAWYEPEFAASAVNFAQRERLAFVSVFPRRQGGGFFASLVEPYLFALRLGFVRPEKVNNAKEREALLSGQCVLARREAYEFYFGHRAIQDNPLVGWALGNLIKRHRMPYCLMRAEHLTRVERGGLWLRVAKDTVRLMRVDLRAARGVLFFGALMSLHLPLVIYCLALGMFLPAALLWLAAVAGWWRWYGWSWQALLMPLAVWVFNALLLAAGVHLVMGGMLRWKGRRV